MTESQKDIRIVVPAFKAGKTIQKCIEAILGSKGFHKNWEIIIVDNGQNPGIFDLLKSYPVTVLERDKCQSAAYARNEGAKGFSDGILIFIDSDVICERNCIIELIKPLQNGLCNATIGNYSGNYNGLSFSQKYKQLYINHIYSREGSNIKNDFWTAICSVDVKIFNNLKGFNTNFNGANGEDQEFGIRLTKNGYSVLSVNKANGQHLNPYGVHNIIRNDLKKGLMAVKNSLENKVPFSDNRHSKKQDILSVFFAVLTITFLTLIPVYFVFLSASISSFLLWFICRIDLCKRFFKNGGILFFISALMLMYTLDLVRCICVIVGVSKNILYKRSFELKESEIPIPVKG